MIGRALDAMRRRVGEPADRPPRPNELRRDVARAERLRQEARRVEAATDQPRRPPEGGREQRAAGDAARAGHPDDQPRPLTALASRSGLRRAWLVKEILGPPRALGGPYWGGPEA